MSNKEELERIGNILWQIKCLLEEIKDKLKVEKPKRSMSPQ